MGVAVCLSIDQTDCLENTEVLKQEVERGEEATTSLEGLSYPKSSISQNGGGLRGVPRRHIY